MQTARASFRTWKEAIDLNIFLSSSSGFVLEYDGRVYAANPYEH